MSIASSIAPNFGPTLAEELRARSDDELNQLFESRPDLIVPIPADIAALATRATSAPSVLRAMEALNQWQIQVLEACALMERKFLSEEIVEITAPEAARILPELWARALIYKDGDGYRIPRNVQELMPEPAGLGPSIAAKVDFKRLDKAPKGAGELLDKLTWGVPRAHSDELSRKGTIIKWLLENNFLVPIDKLTVALPREVGIHLRGGKVHREARPTEPTISGTKLKSVEIERAAVASIATLLRLVSELANFWAEESPTAIQSGGIGVRDLKKAAEHLGVDEPFTAFLSELSHQIGIIVVDSDGRILPTANFDIYQTKNAEEQWRELVAAWRISSRAFGLIGRSESRNVNALGPELDRSNAARIRQLTLEILANNPDLAADPESLIHAVAWHYPHRRSITPTDELVRWTIREAEWLGLTGAGAISTFAVKFLRNEKKLGINSALPDPVDHILIQGDNTAIAPGPLTVEIARQLSTFADIESRGGATVYRFTESSIRRGLDHGHSGEEIRSFLKEVSKTPVPQPLDYLVTDVAKKHGRLRIGNSISYIRCDDESIIKSILNDRKVEHLRLRQIAPQVLISDSEVSDLMAELREAGYFPAGENGQGAVIKAPTLLRAKSRPKPPRIIAEFAPPTPEIMKVAIRTLRTGERTTLRRTTGEIPRNTATETLALINEYLGKGVALRIGYADTNGAVSLRVIDPLSISMGTLIARDHLTNGITPFKIARITGVTPE
ncbi:MAG: hypothetical protein RJB30_510 [Actinomycetota bacterium]